MLSEMVNEYIEKGYKDTAVIVATNEARNLLNTAIHEKLHSGKESVTIKVWDRKDISPVDRLKAQSYSIGDKITIMKSGAGIKVGAEGRVIGIDTKNNSITVVVRIKNNIENRVIDVGNHGDKLAVFQEKEIAVSQGEKVIFTNNVRIDEKGKEKIANSTFGYVENIKNGQITIKTEDGKTVTFREGQDMYFDYGYAITADRSQGKTMKNVITYETRNYENTLVAISRAKENATVYTTNKDYFIEKSKESAMEQKKEEMAYMKNQEVWQKTEVQDVIEKNMEKEVSQETQETTQKQEIQQGKEIQIKTGIYQVETKNTKTTIDKILQGFGIKNYIKLGNIKITEKQKNIAITTKSGILKQVEAGKYVSGEKKGIKIRHEKEDNKGKLSSLWGHKIKGYYVEGNKEKGIYTVTKYEMKEKELGGYKTTKTESFVINTNEIRQMLENAKHDMKHNSYYANLIKETEKALEKFEKSMKQKDFERLVAGLNEIKEIYQQVKQVKQLDMIEKIEKIQKEQQKMQEIIRQERAKMQYPMTKEQLIQEIKKMENNLKGTMQNIENAVKNIEEKQKTTLKVEQAIRDIYNTGKDSFTIKDITKRIGTEGQVKNIMARIKDVAYNKENKKYEFQKNNKYSKETKEAIKNAIQELEKQGVKEISSKEIAITIKEIRFYGDIGEKRIEKEMKDIMKKQGYNVIGYSKQNNKQYEYWAKESGVMQAKTVEDRAVDRITKMYVDTQIQGKEKWAFQKNTKEEIEKIQKFHQNLGFLEKKGVLTSSINRIKDEMKKEQIQKAQEYIQKAIEKNEHISVSRVEKETGVSKTAAREAIKKEIEKGNIEAKNIKIKNTERTIYRKKTETKTTETSKTTSETKTVSATKTTEAAKSETMSKTSESTKSSESARTSEKTASTSRDSSVSKSAGSSMNRGR